MFERLLTTRWRIILAGTLIVAVPLLGLALFVHVDVTRGLERLSSEKRLALASTTAQILEEKLRSEISFGTAYSVRSSLIKGVTNGDAKEMRRHLQNLVETSSSMELALIASPRGILLEAYPALPDLLGKDYSRRDWYRGVSRSWAPYISDFFLRSPKPQYNVFMIAVPIRSDGGKVIGILVMQPKPDFVKKALGSISQAGGTTYLIDNKGTLIYHPNLSQEKMVNISSSHIAKKVMQGHDGYEKGVEPLNGEGVISAYHPVNISGWGVITERPLIEVLAPVKNVTRGIYIFTAIMLLISAWFAYRRSKLIFSLKKTSDELLQEGKINKAYGDVLTLINHEWSSVEELTRAALTQLGSHGSVATGAGYLVQERTLVPLSSMGVPLPAAAGGMVQEALERMETVKLLDIPPDSLLCISTCVGNFLPREILAVPLTAKNEVVAVLELASLHGFGETDLRIINRIAPQLGIGISTIRSNLELKRLSDELQQSNEELQAMNEEAQTMNEELQTMNEELQTQQRELAESNRQLVEVSRTKSDFLANMSHELRTPLNSVIGFSEVLQDQLFGPMNNKQQEYVGNILASGRHLLSLINDILDLSKVESGKMELDLSIFPVRDALDASLMMLTEKALKSGIDLNMELDPEVDVSIEADQRKLKQIMFNLLSNAIKFTPASGTVNVTARKDGDFMEITVTDTGSGIKAEDIPKLFQAFAQLESAYTKEHEGTGLGLALTRRLVELHGGRIRVESEFGKWSKFSFTIPLTQTTAIESHANRPDSVRSTGMGATVLLIEDEQHTMVTLENALQGKGYRVLWANCGKDGVEMARQGAPGLIILDLMMPGMSGFDVADQLSKENSAASAPVLVLTSMDLSAADRERLAGKVWRIEEKGSMSTQEFISLVEIAFGPELQRRSHYAAQDIDC